MGGAALWCAFPRVGGGSVLVLQLVFQRCFGKAFGGPQVSLLERYVEVQGR